MEIILLILLGHPSKVVETVTFQDHIIVSGHDSNLIMFISELRRPSVRGSAYHPILIVNPTIPTKWDAIKDRFNDVYALVGSLTRSMVFNRVNISNAFAVILLASGTSTSSVIISLVFMKYFIYLFFFSNLKKILFFNVRLRKKILIQPYFLLI